MIKKINDWIQFLRGRVGVGLGLILGMGVASLSNILNPPQYGIRYAPVDGIWPGLIAMVIMAFPLIEWHATYHAKKFKEGKYISHGWAMVGRIVIAFALASLINCFSYNLMKVLDLTVFAMLFFGIVFNIVLNKKRRLDLFYLGRGKRSALVDKIFSRINNGGAYLALSELVLMAFTAYLYCLT